MRSKPPLIRQVADHCPDKCALEVFPDQVIRAQGNVYALETRLIRGHFGLATSTVVTFAPTDTIILRFNFGDYGNCVRV